AFSPAEWLSVVNGREDIAAQLLVDVGKLEANVFQAGGDGVTDDLVGFAPPAALHVAAEAGDFAGDAAQEGAFAFDFLIHVGHGCFALFVVLLVGRHLWWWSDSIRRFLFRILIRFIKDRVICHLKNL